MKWELVNPHDKITVEADDFLDAVCAVWLVDDRGAYGLTPIGDGPTLPVLMFASDGAAERWAAAYGGLDAIMDRWKSPGVVAALRSFTLANGKRSSMADPVDRAHTVADKIADKLVCLTRREG